MNHDATLAEVVRQLEGENQPFGSAFSEWTQRLPHHEPALESWLPGVVDGAEQAPPPGVVLGALQLLRRQLADLEERYEQLRDEHRDLLRQLHGLGEELARQRS